MNSNYFMIPSIKTLRKNSIGIQTFEKNFHDIFFNLEFNESLFDSIENDTIIQPK